MIDFSLVKFFLFVVYIVQFSSSHEIKITKCVNTPETWKKVDKSIKECQEDVKLKIIEDAFQSLNGGWDDSFFNHDDQFSWDLNEQEQHPPIDHHASIHDNHNPIPDHFTIIKDHSPSIHNHHTPIHDHPIHDNHYSLDDHRPLIKDHSPSIHDHHTTIHDYHPSIHDHHPSTHDHYPSIHGHYPSIHDHHQSPQFHPTQAHSSIHIEDDHPHIAHQIESPQPFAPSSNQDKHIKTHPQMEHVQSSDSLSNPVEHHHIDFNDFRKKRDANDHGWIHPSTITYHDKRIAGCIMQCIYKKNHAVDQLGWPTLDGLVNFYSEGVNEHGYFMATLRAVDYCLKGSSAKYHVNRRSTPEKGQTCDVAFDVFDCISDRITEYCSDHHLDSNF